jgi:tetratricopeptide (TPR) repeat protein
MFGIVFVLLALSQVSSSPVPDEINDAIAHAGALYDSAHFIEAITLLTRIDDLLSTQPGRLKDKVETKLQLGLNSIGLNDTAKAKSFFVQLYALDLDYALDSQRFSSKVTAIAEDAKTEQTKVWCHEAQTNARTYLDKSDATAFLELLKLSGSKCPALQAMAPEAAEILFRAGLTAYRRGELSDALSTFESALTLSPEHELARQYAELTYGKLELEEERKRKPLR